MKNPTKPCKGHNKAKGFDGCGKPSQYRKHGLCPTCQWDWMHNNETGKIYYEKTFLKKQVVNKNKIEKEQTQQQKEDNKTITQLINEARIPFQKWIRLRDANDGCISCPTIDSQIWDGGHYYKAEIYTGLIFSEINCNKQCRKCNSYLGGNEIGYREGLLKKYGEKIMYDFDKIYDHHRSYKYTREELKGIKKKYQLKIKNHEY